MPVFLDEDGNPRGFIWFNKNRERVLFVAAKADEEEIISLIENKDVKVKVYGKTKIEIPLPTPQRVG